MLAMGALLSGATAKDVTITTWTASTPGIAEWWGVLKEKYEADHPGVELKVENIGFCDYVRTLTTRLIAGSPPTAIHVPLPTLTLPAWAEAGFLKSLDEEVQATDIAKVWPANQAAMMWNGTNFGVLTAHYAYLYFVNEKMLADAGIAIPKTPDELRSAAEALTKDGKYGFAVTDDNTVNFMRDALIFVTGVGGQWVKDGAWNFRDPKVIEGIELWRDLTLNNAPKGTDISAKRQAFYDGNVAMMFENAAVWANVAAAAKPDVINDLHVAPMPFSVIPGDVSHGLSIPEGLSEEDTKLAWELIETATSPDLMRTYVELVKAPVARPGVDESLKATPDTTIIADSAAVAVGIVPNDYYGVRKGYSDFSAELTDALRAILQGTPVAEAMETLESKLTAKGISPLG
jgi:multiple sugar transport system substrate-binding protein